MTVDFLAFATNLGANVIDQATYASLPALGTGFESGTALSDELNKVWRQSSFVSSAIANFMNQQLGIDILDDGNLSGFITNFKNALKTYIPPGARYVSTVGGTANAITLTPSPASASYAAGDAYVFIATGTSSAAVTVNISALGTKSITRIAPSGPVALTTEIVTGNLIIIQYDGTRFQIISPATGTAALKGATDTSKSNVASVSGSFTANNFLAANDTAGTVKDSGVAAGSFLTAANNLSDVASASTSRTNLGLGTAATQNVAAFLQPTNNLSDVSTPSTARTNLGLGTAATQNVGAFLQPGNNLSDISSASASRTNLGLGTAATQAISVWAQVANNLSDLASASTARTNLGLGTAAVQNVGAFLQPGNNLSDVSSTTTSRNNLGLGGLATQSLAASGPVISNSSGAVSIGSSYCVQEQQPSGTGAGLLSAGSYATRVLNAVVGSTPSWASLGSNQITLTAGRYRIWATAPAVNANHKIRLRNVSDGTSTLIGTSEVSPVGNVTRSLIEGSEFSIGGTKTFELQHWANISATAGLPVTSGEVEVYGTVFIELVGV